MALRGTVARPVDWPPFRICPEATSEWRNWQTRQLEGLVPARAWGFKSPLRHVEMLVNADLERADLHRTDLGGANLSDTSPSDLKP